MGETFEFHHKPIPDHVKDRKRWSKMMISEEEKRINRKKHSI